MPEGETEGLLTDSEHAVVEQAGRLWNAICAAVPAGPTRDADLRELIPHVHAIQHAFMANAAARAYPDRYRSLGLSIAADPLPPKPPRPEPGPNPVVSDIGRTPRHRA